MTREEMIADAEAQGWPHIAKALRDGNAAKLRDFLKTMELLQGPLAKVKRVRDHRKNNWEND